MPKFSISYARYTLTFDKNKNSNWWSLICKFQLSQTPQMNLSAPNRFGFQVYVYQTQKNVGKKFAKIYTLNYESVLRKKIS